MGELEPVAEKARAINKPTILRRLWRWTVCLFRSTFFILLFYLVCAIIGLIPVNQDFVRQEKGVTIYVFSGPVHSDIIVPTKNKTIDWRTHFPASDFKEDSRRLTYVAVGWGDRGFFLETPYWEDLKLSTAANAVLLPSRTVMHVAYRNPVESDECKPVVISTAQYERLVEFMLRSFQITESGSPILVGEPYGEVDAFYEARGSYHAFNTCNCWVGNALQHAGVKVGWFTPFPRTVLWHLPGEPTP